MTFMLILAQSKMNLRKIVILRHDNSKRFLRAKSHFYIWVDIDRINLYLSKICTSIIANIKRMSI